MKLIINPEFNSYSSFIESIPSIFDREGETIYKARNEIKIFSINGVIFNVKSYKVPILINRIAYTFFRATKAKRAYEYALRLLSLDILTPTPVAYIEEKQNGLLSHAYFISLHTPMEGNLRLFGLPNNSFEETKDLAIAFAQYTAHLHEKRVLHIDYSPGNILYEKRDDGSYNFSLIDINRMKFCDVDMQTGCANFARMWGSDQFFETIAYAYAKERGWDEKICKKIVFEARDEDRKQRKKKEEFKKKIRSLLKK